VARRFELKGAGVVSKEATIATVIGGEHEGKHVCIYVEFEDGDCVVELPNTGELATIKAEDLRRWRRVEVVSVC
jgi:hypothetical protein